MIYAETNRFILRDIELRDTDGMFLLDSDPEVHRFLGNRPIKTREEARRIIEHIQMQRDKYGIGRWAIIDQATDDFIGWTGLKYEERIREEFNYYDLGYRLRRKYWGKGIATETAPICLHYGFEKLHLQEIGAAANVQHTASIHILTKVGMKFVETFTFDYSPHNWYQLKKFDWLQLQL